MTRPLMGRHEPEPEPDTFRDRHGNPAQLTDQNAYPGTATCRCGRKITAAHYLAPFHHDAIASDGAVTAYGLTVELSDTLTGRSIQVARSSVPSADGDFPGPSVTVAVLGKQGGIMASGDAMVGTTPLEVARFAMGLLRLVKDVDERYTGPRTLTAATPPAEAP